MSKKIGLVLALDGEKEFTQAVQNAQKNANLFKTELKNLSQQFEGNANSMAALQAKQEALTRQQQAYQTKLEAAKTGLSNANKAYNEQSEALEALKKALEEAKDSQQKMEKSGDTVSDTYKECCNDVKDLSEAVDKQSVNTMTAAGRVTDWNKRVAESEGDLRKTNTALSKNEQYLKEAEAATNQCATSIDKFGNEIKDTTGDLENAGEKTSTFKDMLKANLTGTAIISGVKEVAGAAKEAAEYVVEVGSSFEAGMSKVEALSGASGNELDSLSQKAQQLGRTTQYSATEAAEALSNMALAGWSTQEMLDGIDGVLQLAASGQMDLAAASETVAGYLAAFNMQASESGKLADVIATAQARSKMTADQLSEAYGTSATNMTQYGQAMTTTTAALEGFAKVNDTGSSAGTKLSAIMAQITAKMKEGKIAIGDTTVEVQDQNGNFRDLIDIIADVEKATDGLGDAEKASALATTFNRTSLSGLNELLAVGSDKLKDYRTELENCDGAASDMMDTMTDNLEGDKKALDSALEGLGITAYSYIEGPLRSAAQGVTEIISGITEAIAPQKTELQTFIDEVKASNGEVQEILENAAETVTQVDIDVSNLEAYKQMLVDLAGQEELSEYQKYQVKNAVDALAGSIPELAAAFDEESGKINLTSAEIVGLIENQEELIRQQAYAKASQEAYEVLYMAQLNQAKAQSAYVQAQKQWTEVAGEGIKTANEYVAAWGEAPDNVLAAERALQQTQEELNKANESVEEAQEIISSTEEAVNKMAESEKKASQAHKDKMKAISADIIANSDLTDKQKEVAAAFGGVTIEAEKTTEALQEEAEAAQQAAEDGAEAQKQAAQTILDTYHGYVDEIKSDLQEKINPFEKFDTSRYSEDFGDNVTVEGMTENLNSQIEAFENYQESLEAVKEHVGKEISPEFMQYLENMGVEGKNTLDHILQTYADGEPEKIKELNDRWVEAMDLTESMAEVSAANKVAYEAAMGELGSSNAEFSELKEAINGAVTGTMQEELNSAVEIAQQMGVKIPDGLAEGIASGETTPESALAQLNGTIQGAMEGLMETAKEAGIGDDILSGLAEGINAGGEEALDAYNQLVALLIQKNPELQQAIEDSAQADKIGEKVGSSIESGANAIEEAAPTYQEKAQALGEAIAEGIRESGEEIKSAVSEAVAAGAEGIYENEELYSQAGTTLSEAAIESARQQLRQMQEAGQQQAQAYSAAINSARAQATAAGKALAEAAKSGASAGSGGFDTVGIQMAAGVAAGIRTGQAAAIQAAANMARQSLAAAKAALDIHSPSKKFQKDVGQQVGKGFAFGIKDSASLAGAEATKMSSRVYTKATAWLSKYKKSQKVSLADEKYYWQQVAKHTQEGTDAYNKAISKMLTASVSKTTTSGSGKNKKTVKKDAETYYSEIYSAAEKYLSNQKILNDWSLKQELSYWTSICKQLKTGTQAWYDATAKIKDLKADIAQAEAEELEAQIQAEKQRIQTLVNVQKSIIDKYKVYNNVSAKAEMDYWDIARQQFAEGTDERIDADQNYLEAKEEYYDQLKELDEDYAENSKEINDELEESIKDLQDAYDDAVASRKQDILSSMSLFESWDAGGYTKEVLTANLKTQVEGLRFWEEQLGELAKKNVSKDLLDELAEMGPEAAASIWSLNQMTGEELEEYNALWTEKNELARKQALKENEDLLKDTNDKIAEARRTAQDELAALKSDYDAAVQELNTGLSEGLQSLVTQAANIGEEIVSALINAVNNASTQEQMSQAVGEIISTYQAQQAETQTSEQSSDPVLEIINAGTSRSKTLTSKEKKEQSDLWQYIVSKYGRTPYSGSMKKLADALGVSTSKDPPTASEKTKILKKLKEAGYARGIRRITADDEYWVHPGELLVRKKDKATLQYMDEGDGVIPARLTENLMDWGSISPQEFLSEARASVQVQNEALRQQMQTLGSSGIERLNRMTENYQPQTTMANVDNGNLADLLEILISAVNGLSEKMGKQQIVMDTGALVGAIQPSMSRENAAVTIRRNRGRL